MCRSLSPSVSVASAWTPVKPSCSCRVGTCAPARGAQRNHGEEEVVPVVRDARCVDSSGRVFLIQMPVLPNPFAPRIVLLSLSNGTTSNTGV